MIILPLFKKLIMEQKISYDQEMNCLDIKKKLETSKKYNEPEIIFLHEDFVKMAPTSVIRDKITLDLPFPFCYLEIIGDATFGLIQKSNEKNKWQAMAIAIEEIGPEDYLFFYAPLETDTDGYSLICTSSDTGAGRFIANFLKHVFDNIKKSDTKIGTVGRSKIKIKNNKQIKIEVNRVIYITNKKYNTQSMRGPNNQPIDWSHRWEVRGHWRKLKENKLGRNRHREYVINGFTWVKEYEKGKQDSEVIKKTRIFQSEGLNDIR